MIYMISLRVIMLPLNWSILPLEKKKYNWLKKVEILLKKMQKKSHHKLYRLIVGV